MKQPIVLTVGEWRTRDGNKAVVTCVNAPGNYPCIGYVERPYDGESYAESWRSGGECDTEGNPYDLIAPWAEPVSFDWSCLPKWANKAIAMDEDGAWFSYGVSPKVFGDGWIYTAEEFGYTGIPQNLIPCGFIGSWTESLMLNPNLQQVSALLKGEEE